MTTQLCLPIYSEVKSEVIHDDCLNAMQQMADNSIDFIVTDPPYGINFMSKKFDNFKNQPAFSCQYWQEALRICKPGSMVAAFGGDRTHHHLMYALEVSGWEIRTCIYWLFGSGFPKSHNKFGFDGYGTALKPAAEIIVLAMKPLDGTFAQNAEKWGVAGINIDASRVGIPEDKRAAGTRTYKGGTLAGGLNGEGELQQAPHDGLGRWPANLILDEESAAELDKMTGVSKSNANARNNKARKGNSMGQQYDHIGYGHNDSGGCSRFFYCAKASSSERNRGLEGMPLKKNDFLHGGLPNPNFPEQNRFPKQNIHPTVKPIALMKYIIKLLAPPGNPILLDPFAGSGSTLVAAKELGISAIGIEKEQEYVEIAKARLK